MPSSWKTQGSLNWLTGVLIELLLEYWIGKLAPSHSNSGLVTSIGLEASHFFGSLLRSITDNNIFSGASPLWV